MTPSEDSDDGLLARIGRGDAAAFTHLVVRHRRRLTALASRIVGTAGAEDIVQETFTRAWVHAPAWKAELDGSRPSYAAWLSRVAMNLALDQMRRRPMLPLEAAPDVVDGHEAADETMVARERFARLQAAMHRLPERQRTALGLTYDAELSNAEAAATMDTSIGAFELLLVRARRTLRAALRDEVLP